MEPTRPPKPLIACITVLLLGYGTGLQLGRMAPYALRLSETYGFSLSTIGWLTSLVTLFVAAFAIPTSRAIPKLGIVRAIKIGAVAMTVGAALFAFAETLAFMVAARAVEAAGHIITVIAAPSYLATQAPKHLRRIFLAFWSSFQPVGFALSSVLSASFDEDTKLMMIWLTYAAIIGVIAVLVLLVLDDSSAKRSPKVGNDATGQTNIAWPLVFAFGTYAFLSIGFFTFLPTYEAGQDRQWLSSGMVPLFVPLGSFVAAFIFSKASPGLPPKVIGVGFLTIAVAALLIFSAANSDGSPQRALYAFACGITAASIFTSVPVVTQSPKDAAITFGAIAQAGGLMVLLGAPLAGFILEGGEWQRLGYAFALAAVTASAVTVFGVRNQGV